MQHLIPADKPQLVVALDMPDSKAALALARKVLPATPWVKVGLELFTFAGPQVVGSLKEMGCKVFLDLKFHDIPNTVYGAVKSALGLGADMCNIHLSGGLRMAEAARKALEDSSQNMAGKNFLLLGVTVLTSTAPEELPAEFRANLPGLVLQRARLGKEAGLAGVVCSGQEAAMIKAHCGPEFICLCPGIRPAEGDAKISGPGKAADDQRRTMTPQEAVQAGADFLVTGRPISAAADPAEAALRIAASMLEV